MLFFLNACIHRCQLPQATNVREKRSFQLPFRAPWFQNIDEFAELFNGKHVKFDVGYHPTMLQASKFLRLSLPLAYLLIKLPVETMATMNRLYAFLFLLDFCTSIATLASIIWGDGRVVPNLDQFELSGMGKALPVLVSELHAFMNKMLLSI